MQLGVLVVPAKPVLSRPILQLLDESLDVHNFPGAEKLYEAPGVNAALATVTLVHVYLRVQCQTHSS